MRDALWEFALNLYALPGVADDCLTLQAQGEDVCLLLCLCWLERRGIARSTRAVEQLRELASPWQNEVITPLRLLRQQWRDAAQRDERLTALRDQLKQLELHAEQTLLQRLQAVCETWPAGQPAAWLTALPVLQNATNRPLLQRLQQALQQTEIS